MVAIRGLDGWENARREHSSSTCTLSLKEASAGVAFRPWVVCLCHCTETLQSLGLSWGGSAPWTPPRVLSNPSKKSQGSLSRGRLKKTWGIKWFSQWNVNHNVQNFIWAWKVACSVFYKRALIDFGRSRRRHPGPYRTHGIPCLSWCSVRLHYLYCFKTKLLLSLIITHLNVFPLLEEKKNPKISPLLSPPPKNPKYQISPESSEWSSTNVITFRLYISAW